MSWLVFIHVLGAVMFLGNVMTAAFWKIKAELAGDIAHLHKVTKNVMLADYIFTLPGIVLIVITGVIMTLQLGYSLAELNWLTAAIALFAVTGLIWVSILIPCQLRMIRESHLSMRDNTLTPEYRKASRRWDVFGVIATLLPIATLFFMMAKPF